MDREQAKELIKNMEPTFLDKARVNVNGHATYICPSCGNGSGSSGDGIALDPHSDSKRYKCFVCGLSEDVIGLWKLHTGTEDYTDALNGLIEYYGLQRWTGSTGDSSRRNQNQPKSERNTQDNTQTNTYTHTHTQPASETSQYCKECMERVGSTDYPQKRGLSEETIKKYGLGYDPHFKTKDQYTGQYTEWEALVIPTGSESCVIRNTDPEAKSKNRLRKRGSSQLYNIKALTEAQTPIFIVEGEIDALSVIEVGGEAVGLGSTANHSQLVRILESQKPAQPLVIALDNDSDGEKTAKELVNDLERLKIPFYRLNVYGEAKDANEALQRDREGFKNAVASAADLQKEELEAEKRAYMETSVASHIPEFLDGIADSVNTPYIPTGFKTLDRKLDGGLFEGLYIVGAVSSLGKTTLLTQIADQIAQEGTDVIIFSLEMARTELMAKSISRLTLLDVLANNGDLKDAKTTRGITTGSRYRDYPDREKELIQRAVEEYSLYAGNLYVSEGVGDIGVSEVRETVQKHIKLTGKKPVVIIDYLQILAPADIRATDKQNTDRAVLELKRISRDFKIPVIGISSFNRDNYTEKVNMASFKESGAIEYSSDVLIGLQYRGAGDKNFNAGEAMKKNPREVELVILKNRNGAAGESVDLEYYKLFNYFREVL